MSLPLTNLDDRRWARDVLEGHGEVDEDFSVGTWEAVDERKRAIERDALNAATGARRSAVGRSVFICCDSIWFSTDWNGGQHRCTLRWLSYSLLDVLGHEVLPKAPPWPVSSVRLQSARPFGKWLLGVWVASPWA